MGNMTEMANDHSEGEDHSHSADGEGMMMDANMTMNGTEANMTMNATEMANDTIAEGEMPAEEGGRRRLLQLGDAISGAVDNAKETAKDVAGKVEETARRSSTRPT